MLKPCTGPDCNAMVEEWREWALGFSGVKLRNPRRLCPKCVRLARRYVSEANYMVRLANKDSIFNRMPREGR